MPAIEMMIDKLYRTFSTFGYDTTDWNIFCPKFFFSYLLMSSVLPSEYRSRFDPGRDVIMYCNCYFQNVIFCDRNWNQLEKYTIRTGRHNLQQDFALCYQSTNCYDFIFLQKRFTFSNNLIARKLFFYLKVNNLKNSITENNLE